MVEIAIIILHQLLSDENNNIVNLGCSEPNPLYSRWNSAAAPLFKKYNQAPQSSIKIEVIKMDSLNLTFLPFMPNA